MVEKKTLRHEMKEKMRGLSHGEHASRSLEIKNKITALPEWFHARIIGVTLSTQEEIDTELLIRQAWAENKRVVVPKADPKAKSMDFREIHSFDDTEEAFAGIREPIPEITTSVTASEIDLLIVPGLVFDERGYRIGFGGGFYDRFLAGYHGKTLSLAYDFQVMNEIPTEPFDLPVQMIVTNSRVIRTGDVK